MSDEISVTESDTSKHIASEGDVDEGAAEEGVNEDASVENDDEEEMDAAILTKNYQENPLKLEIMQDCLQMLAKVGNGLNHAFIKLVVVDLNLTNVYLVSNYIHLRFIDLSGNKIRDTTPLRALYYLTTLKMDRNLISLVNLQPLLFLQRVSFAHNFIHLSMGFYHPLVTQFNLSFNRLKTMSGCKFNLLQNLVVLQLNDNKMTSFSGIGCPNLKKLYIANNGLESFEGIEDLVNLEILHVRKNKFRFVDQKIQALKNLNYLNLRQNKLKDIEALINLSEMPNLKNLVLLDNPVARIDNYRQEVLIAIPSLKRLDKELFLDMDYREANEVKVERKEELRMKQLALEAEEEEKEEEEEEDEEEDVDAK